MTRPRGVAVLAGAALMTFVLTGSPVVSSASTPSNVTISWWTWTANPKDVIANFEKANPDITVPMPPDLGVSGGGFYEKLTTALAGGTAPCVAQVEYSYLPYYIGAHDLLNIAQYADQYKSDYPAWVWGQVSQGNAVYALPEDIGPTGFMYQPAVYKKYNLVCADHLGPVRLGRCRTPQGQPQHVPRLLLSDRRAPLGGAVVAGRCTAHCAPAQRLVEDNRERADRAEGH